MLAGFSFQLPIAQGFSGVYLTRMTSVVVLPSWFAVTLRQLSKMTRQARTNFAGNN